ncbi:aminotransferase class I/II-fold pyridoxal phosphate-dependent enzyme [Flammeovirga yaeyamensis]|uniref:Aminotransferase n=1 Tax=Flammeovirga yaeyamensis TaxID=367791 RepID=A0AAX1N6W2_9BACT|nr:pyridoxal phosphate-dependent aminotransferase [Flammeovirga yaeyamensis]MBB3701157.1 aspartate aminotransferase [Flammeovirga yaeyamensis]NMF38376.1 pyridoxal phosphate-dependent aminotransferase [Flammeovirga yaeyamensis]QWG01623.1 aminotransferase class I/II-fold pyridoxal phosphate-dependent enzyme [Flammeovirga yaeyamensis]
MGTQTESKLTLSNRFDNITESATLVMAVKARELQAKGVNVIKLNLGEPDFPTPQYIQDAAKEAIDEGKYFSYPPVPGYPELRQAIADKLDRENNLSYKAENIVVSAGAKHSVANVMLSILNPGDEVIVFSPYWVSYTDQIHLAGGTPVILSGSIENDFKVTPEELRAAITPNTKAILFSSPCNPTGTVFTKEELRGIADEVVKHDNIYIVSDEIYEYINFGGKHFSIAQFDDVKDRTVVVNGFSKGFAMTGWRIGYVAAPLHLAKACTKIQGQVTSGINTITQRACIAALKGDSASVIEEMRTAYLRRRDLLKSMLDEIEGVKTNLPQGAFYIFPDFSAFFGKSFNGEVIKDSSDLCMFFLNEAHVSTVAGAAFGAPNCIRISYAASDEELVQAVKQIKEALNKLS